MKRPSMPAPDPFEFLRDLAFTPTPQKFDDVAQSDALLVLDAAGLVEAEVSSDLAPIDGPSRSAPATLCEITPRGRDVLQRYDIDPRAEPDVLLGTEIPRWRQPEYPANPPVPDQVPKA